MNDRRKVSLTLITNEAHLHTVIETARRARVSLWIASANLKETLVEAPIGTRARASGRYISFFEVLHDLCARGVLVRVLHARAPSAPLARTLKRAKVPMRLCPRVHLKTAIVDGAFLYLGSANLTGAGLGAKAATRRNFEIGITTDDDVTIDQVQREYERIWSGRACKGCGLRSACPKPLDTLGKDPTQAQVRAPPLPSSKSGERRRKE